MRLYSEPILNFADVYTIEEWNAALSYGGITEYDGRGYWCKDGMESGDDPFETDQEDATHIAWYNK